MSGPDLRMLKSHSGLIGVLMQLSGLILPWPWVIAAQFRNSSILSSNDLGMNTLRFSTGSESPGLSVLAG
ncbi:hypothetical protein BMS3Bbin10_01615 [bacterium BMS3Bbin10]|nr:hypothetical protein BMS3Bbin10_01615 [bacterium BMS3Bbin10]